MGVRTCQTCHPEPTTEYQQVVAFTHHLLEFSETAAKSAIHGWGTQWKSPMWQSSRINATAHLACTVKACYIPASHSVTFHTQTPLVKPASHNIHQAPWISQDSSASTRRDAHCSHLTNIFTNCGCGFPPPSPRQFGLSGGRPWFFSLVLQDIHACRGNLRPSGSSLFSGVGGVCVGGSLLCCCLLLSHEEDSSDQLLCVLTSKLLTDEGSVQSQAPSRISKAVCVQMLVSQVTKIQYWATLKCFIPKKWEIHIQRRRGLPRGTAFTNMTNMQWIQV